MGELLQLDSDFRVLSVHQIDERRPVVHKSQSAPIQKRKKKLSPNHVPRKPANAHVISSIIESLAPPTSRATYTQGSTPASDHVLSKHGKRRHAPPTPAPKVKRSESATLDMECHPYSHENDQDESDAAEYPVIRTARRPSERPPYARSSSSNISGLKSYLRSTSRNSIGSQSSPQQEIEKNKLSRSSSLRSIDGWVRRTSSPVKTPQDGVTPTKNRTLSLQTVSQETLETRKTLKSESVQAEIHMKEASFNLPTTPMKQSESASTPSNEVDIRPKDISDRGVPETIVDDSLLGSSSHKENSDVKTLTKGGPPYPKLSPQKNSIADAIPLRTSSLDRTPRQWQKSRSGKGKRAHRKPAVDTLSDMFDGLDEEDETVKRIKELRQQKESRLQKEVSDVKSGRGKPLPETVTSVLSNAQPPAPSTSSTLSPSHRSEPTANKLSATRQPDERKANKLPGKDEISESDYQASPSTRKNQRHCVASLELISQTTPISSDLPSESTDVKKNIPSLLLSDAHAETVNSTGESPRGSSKNSKRIIEATTAGSRLLNGLDLDGLEVSPPSTSHASHSDLPTDLDKGRRRRKSMSDARNDRALEDEILAERRNSVSDAVADFLEDPRLNQTIRHPQTGRVISFSEVGDPNGAAVIVCVGMGLTRFVTAFYDELATTLRLRLITPDRPGVGASEAYPDRDRIGPLGWPDDVLAITQHLRISKFSILAHSAGAIYALATALILPHCIHGRVQLLAPWIPPSQFEHYGSKDRSTDSTPVGSLPRSQRLLRIIPIPILKAANGGFLSPSSLKPASVRKSPTSPPGRDGPPGGAPKKFRRRPDPLQRESMILLDEVVVPEKPVQTMFPLPGLTEEDASAPEVVERPIFDVSATATPTDPAFTFAADALNAAEHSHRERQAAYSTLLTERTWTLATLNSNPAVDLLVCLERYRDIGFRYVDIQRQIVITHGSEDKRVSADNVKWIGEQINRRAATKWSPDAKDERREMGGCEVRILPGEGHGLMASPAVMADVLTDIAGEWVRKRQRDCTQPAKQQ